MSDIVQQLTDQRIHGFNALMQVREDAAKEIATLRSELEILTKHAPNRARSIVKMARENERFERENADLRRRLEEVERKLADAPVIDTCDQGHKFSKLPDHPLHDGQARCPHCMEIWLNNAELQLAAVQNDLIKEMDKAANAELRGADAQKPEAVETNDKEDSYLMGSCTESECQLCRTPKFARKPGMHHSGLTAWDKP